jgi:hypothetical protein
MGGITECDYANGLRVLLYPDAADPKITVNVTYLWSGDVYSTWEMLKTHVPVAINIGTVRHSILGHRHRRLRADA